MATQGPLYPGTVTTESISTESANDWLTPGNISADDGSEAQITAATYDSPDISFRLKAQNLGFTIPAGATIDGITVEIDRRSIIASSGVDFRVQLLDAAGALVGTNKASATVWPTSSTIATYGGAADTWTASPTQAMVNDVDFGVVLSVTANIANADIAVDTIRVTVNYTSSPDATATPATVGGIVSVPAPTVLGAATPTPAVVAAIAAVPTPTIVIGGPPDAPQPIFVFQKSTAVSTLQGGDTLQGAGTGGASATATPATVAVTVSIPAPTVIATSPDATATPATVAAVATIPGPAVLAAAIAIPSTVAAVAAVPASTILAAAKPTPATAAVVGAVPAPTVQGAAQPTPGAVAVVGAVPTPTVQGTAIVTPAAIAVVVSVPTPAVLVGGDATVPATSVAAVASIPGPVIQAAARPTPSAVAAVVAVPTVVVMGRAVTVPATVVALAAVPTPLVLLVPPIFIDDFDSSVSSMNGDSSTSGMDADSLVTSLGS
jgi:hypothetical protein